MWNRFKTFDPWLYVLPLILMIVSVVVIYTLTIDSSGPGLYVRQAAYGVLSLVIMLVVTFTDYRSLKAWAPWIYLAGLIGLILVKLPGIGKSDFGAQRWINLGFMQLQPSELEKVIIVIAMGALLSGAGSVISGRRFFIALLGILVPVAAVILQPDLGTAIVIAVASIVMVLYSKLQRWQTVFIVVSLVAIVTSFALSFHNVKPFGQLLKGYQKDRLASFIEPSRDQTGSGYNIVQSVIAVGSGGLTGQGLGFGSQSQLNFLPVAHADFIFAGIAEAWGLLGTWSIIAIFMILLLRMIQAARIAKDDFGMLICIGLAVKILVEVLVNMGMNIQLMPVTGIPLPFLSYGGTTLITNALAIGIVQSVVIRYKRLTF